MRTATDTTIVDGARLLARHGGIVEVRILRTPRGTISGYFDDTEALAREVAPWDGRANIYVTLNPVNPTLLARAVNRLREYVRTTTADRDVLRRVWFPVDLDPKRPNDISSTADELKAALTRRNEVTGFLRELGFPDGIRAMSGNGAHALYAVDLPNDEATTKLFQEALKALKKQFGDNAVDVDESVFNAARIWKFYGTRAVKGDPTADRPHRRAVLEHVPSELVPTDLDALRALAAMAPGARTWSGPTNGHRSGRAPLDVLDVFKARGLYRQPLSDRRHAVTCPWVSEHSCNSGLTETVLFEPREPDGCWGFDCKHAHCAHRTIRDVIAHVDVGARPESAEADLAPPGTWPKPEPLPNSLSPVRAFDANMLPARLRPWVADISERAQCPPDFVAVAAVAAAAAVIGRKIAIRPKREDDWTVVPNLWGLVVGRPGVMKTPALQEALKPLYRLVADAHLEYQRKMTEHEFHMAEAQARRETRKKQLREAIENKQSIDDLRHAFEAPSYVAPSERRYVVNDSTVEKLGELLNQNRNGLLLYRDELTGFLQMMDRQGHENDRAFYCEAWNGTGPYTYDRIGRGTLHIEAACISVLGGIQPGPLHQYLREVFGEGRDDGLIQRFQLLVYPDTGGPWRNVDRWPDAEAKRMAFEVFRQLNAMDPTEIAAHELSPDELPFLRFTPEGQEVFNRWRSGLEAKIRSDDEHPVIVSHLAKYRSLMPALALILHVIECLAEGTGGPVSQAAAERAVAWCTYLEAHARRVYQSVTAAGRIAASLLAAKLTAGKLPNPFRVRDVHRAGWAGLGDRGDVVRAIEMLEDLQWVRRQDVRPPQGGRPTAHFYINPKVRGITT